MTQKWKVMKMKRERDGKVEYEKVVKENEELKQKNEEWNDKIKEKEREVVNAKEMNESN